MARRAFDRPQLDTQFCLNIVIDATGHRDDFENIYHSDLTTTLNNLGIIDKDQSDAHKAQIQSLLYAKGYQIKQKEIKTGPAVAVSACLYSVRDNAK
jgi:hypothetical protein